MDRELSDFMWEALKVRSHIYFHGNCDRCREDNNTDRFKNVSAIKHVVTTTEPEPACHAQNVVCHINCC